MDKALELFRKSVELNAKQTDVNYMIGEVQLEMKKPEEAMETFKHILELDGYNGDAHFGMAMSYKDLGQKDKSIEEYNEAINLFTSDLNSTVPEMNMRSAEAHYNLSVYHLEDGKKEEAIKEMLAAGADYEKAILGISKKKNRKVKYY